MLCIFCPSAWGPNHKTIMGIDSFLLHGKCSGEKWHHREKKNMGPEYYNQRRGVEKNKSSPPPLHTHASNRLCMAASSSKKSSSRFLCGRLFVMPRHYLRLMENYENVMPFWESCCHLHVQTKRVLKINTSN